MLKTLMVTTAIGALMIGAAAAEGTPQPPAASPPAAQSTPAPTPVPSSAKVINTQKPDQFLASKFKGTDVLGSDDAKIGDISDILFDRDGKIEAYVVSVGGFLGIGSKYVAMEPAAFQVVAGDKSKNESDKLKVSMTKDQLKEAANFEAYSPPRTTTGMGGAGPTPRPAPATPAR